MVNSPIADVIEDGDLPGAMTSKLKYSKENSHISNVVVGGLTQ